MAKGRKLEKIEETVDNLEYELAQKEKELKEVKKVDEMPKPVQKVEEYPKKDWMEIRADPELNKVVGMESYEKGIMILLWRILKKFER